MSKLSRYKMFVAVVETGSVIDAAEKLNLTAPAVSKQLTQLEDELQVQLFYRAHKKLEITEAGKLFYPKCQQILSDIIRAEEELLAANNDVAGKISITLSKALCRSAISDVLAGFVKVYPHIKFDVRYGDELEDLYNSHIDFAFRLGELKDSADHVAIPLTRTQLTACATPNYLKQHGDNKYLASLDASTLITVSPLNASQELKKFFKQEKINIDSSKIHTTNDIEGVYQLVKAGMGVGFMLDVSVEKELASGEFKSVATDTPLPSKALHLIYKKRQWNAQKLDLFKRYVKDYFLGA